MVAFSGILESPKPPPSGDVHGNVPAYCHGHQFGHLFRVIIDCCLFFCCPGGCWGNTELVVIQCRHPGASSVALDLLNQAMPRASLQCVRMAIKMACNGGVLLSLARPLCWVARHSYFVDSSNPRRWRGKQLHQHGGGVCCLFVLLWMDL
jgi:hypothetical protein